MSAMGKLMTVSHTNAKTPSKLWLGNDPTIQKLTIFVLLVLIQIRRSAVDQLVA